MYIWLPSLKIFLIYYGCIHTHTVCLSKGWKMGQPNGWTELNCGAGWRTRAWHTFQPSAHCIPYIMQSFLFASRVSTGFPLKKGKMEIISLFDRLLTSYFFCPGLEKKKTLFLFIYSVFFFFFCRFLCFKLCQRGFCWLHFQSERKNVQPLTLSIFTRGYYISTSFFFLRSSAVILNVNH